MRHPSELTLYERAATPRRAKTARSANGLPPPSFAPWFESPEQQGGASLWSMLDDRMSGRWKWAIPCAIVLGIGLGVLGFLSTSPTYRSVGAVRVVPQVPVVLHQTEIHTLRDPDRFRSTQIQYMKNPRVLERTLLDEEVAKLEWSKTPEVMKTLRENLNVERDRDSELIYVWFESESPVVAQVVTNAVLRAYYDIYGKNNGQDVPGTLAELKDTEARYVREQNAIQIDRRMIDTKYQTSELIQLQRANIQQLGQLESQIRAGKRELQRAVRNNPEQSEGVSDLAPDMQALEQMNPLLAMLRQEWSEAQIAFDSIKDRYMPGRLLYESRKDKAERARELYDLEYRKTVDDWQKAGGPLLRDGSAVALLNADDIAALEADHAQLQQRQQELVNDISRRDELTYREQAVQRELDQIRGRISSLEIESKSLGGFISIAHYGTLEDEPHANAQKKRAIMGLSLGMMASFGGFFLLGTIDRRAFGASQLQSKPGTGAPYCLGVLPDLGASLSNPESSDVASHCVHQIRNQIEALRDPHTGFVLAVTSPFQGDGKTSIVMALGWSYAAAGYNTLVIDCDLVGRSLTRQLGLTGREGLRDALLARDLNGSVSRMPVDNLSAVPAGVDLSFGPENLRCIDLEGLLQQVRDKYDIILVDTGPMLGSLESMPVAAAADGVVLSVRRGRSRSRLEECVSRLEVIGAECVGVILNCAGRSDCHRYVSEASLAAAEEERAGRIAGEGATELVHVAPGERNALVRAMQHTRRVQKNSR